jgi:hypothetical protein
MTPSWFIVKNAVPTTNATVSVLFRCRGVRATETSSRNVDHVGAVSTRAGFTGPVFTGPVFTGVALVAAEFVGVVFIWASDDQGDVVEGRPGLPQIPPYRYGT